MAMLEYAAIGESISASEPCGPDLDIEGDADFLQFMARVEYLLPVSFFSHDVDGQPVPFDRSSIDFKAEFAKLARLLEATRDLRLLTIGCRLHALDRDLAGCADGLAAIAGLLTQHWDAVHPRGDGGDFGYRFAILQALDDAPTMILPLQHLPLFTHRRYGAVSLRSATVAAGNAQARAGETALDGGELGRALRDADPAALDLARASAQRLREAALSIAATTARESADGAGVTLDRLVSVADGIITFLGSGDASTPAPAQSAAPSAELPSSGAGLPQATTTLSAIPDFREARAALVAVIGYFDAHEPSSPAALLVRQAERLIGLPFHEVIRALLPAHVEEASIHIGPSPERSFEIRIDRMTEAADGLSEAAGAGPDASVVDGAAAGLKLSIASRADAIALLRQVSTFYRMREPASPIPLFVDRACAMADKDFLMILADVLPGVRLSRITD